MAKTVAMRLAPLSCLLVALALASPLAPAAAQAKGPLDPQPLPPLAKPSDPSIPARQLFARKTEPTSGMPPRSVGFYAKGCLAGGVELPINGTAWQVMRLSRNRNWGHPELIEVIERIAKQARAQGWPGLLTGDMSQPRGGPMISGHASHQVGLDADIWLTPMPQRELTREEREEMSATMVVAQDRRDVDPAVWTPAHAAVIKAAAEQPEVERILVNAAIKKALCREAGTDRDWLHKVRPYWGHDYHFHIRLFCPDGDTVCKPQPPAPPGDGCGKELDWWFRDAVLRPLPEKPPPGPRAGITMAALPPACRAVLAAP